MTVVTRFAPSPTGFLHVGGARTALFNWLYARHHGGQYRLRIEDTDRKRSTPEAIAAIIDGLNWLKLDSDAAVVYQSENLERHAAAAKRLLQEGKAYHCYCSPEELAEMRETAKKEGRAVLYDGRWRGRDPSEAPAGVPPVIRIKMPREGETAVEDMVQGTVTVANTQLDDFVLMRADGTPTYMLSVVVDDHDMGVTDVIRGDDHLNNAFRQYHLFRALGWNIPRFGHIPLIHGPDGKKLSKRHGALGVDAYREMGYLPAAMRNYLLRLGWSHGDDEIISTAQAIEWFDMKDVGRSPARFDFAKLDNLNGHYIRETPNADLTDMIAPLIERAHRIELDAEARRRLTAGMEGLKQRAKTLVELAENAAFYVVRPHFPLTNQKAAKLLSADGIAMLRDIHTILSTLDAWNSEELETHLRRMSEEKGLGLGKLAQPLRAALTGSNASPSLFEVMEVLGREETLDRIATAPETAA